MKLFSPSHSTSAGKPAAALLGGIGIGAALMYLLDPDRGRRRRALVRDKAVHLANLTGDRLAARSRDWRNRARGVAARAKPAGAAPAADDALVARVRSELGRAVRNPGAIDVSARQGRVTLTGPILSEERSGAVSRAQAVAGVESVEDRLEPHEEPGDIPALQGARGPRGKAERGAARFDTENA